MGTRGSVIIIQDKKAKGYYNQYDCYPDGLGEELIEELKKVDKVKDGWKQFMENMKKVKLVKESEKPSEEVQKKYKENGFYSSNVSTGSSEEWYCLLRELQGAKYIRAIMAGKIEHMVDGTNFIQFSLSCEYAYVVDLDNMVLEFYKGFQKKPQKGNRFGEKKAEGYFPCAKVGQLSLKGISDDDMAVEIMNEVYEKFSKEEEEN